MTLWHGRFADGMSDTMRALGVSIATDIRLLPYDIRVNRAWAHALQRAGLLTADEVATLEAALTHVGSEFADAARGVASIVVPDEDVHSLVERRLTELIGPTGAKIHTGRSRNDQVATDMQLYLRDHATILQEALVLAVRALTEQATAHQTTIMPGYTHVQQAQPIALAHYLLSAAWALAGCHARLGDCMKHMDHCPLGSGALAGSAYPIDRMQLARDLGFSAPTPNSIAAVSGRDDLLELTSLCAQIAIHGSRYAEDWIMWSGQAYGFVTFADAVTTGSSMMPQKKNPDALELIRGKTARIIGQMQTMYTLVKGLPLTYARDLQEDKPAVFDAIDQTLLCIAGFTDVVHHATFHPDTMRAALDPGLFATELADYLVRKGLPFRQAHEVVGGLVRTSLEQKKPLSEWTIAAFAAASPLFTDDAHECFSPEAALARRNLIGGTGPESITEQLRQLQCWLTNPAQESV